MDALHTFLNREGETKVAQAIETEWKRRVLKSHREKAREPRESPDDNTIIYRQYGSTLVGLLLTPRFVFAFQLGDGDIVLLDDSGIEDVMPENDRILGVETHSLSGSDAWKRAVCVTKRRNIADGLPYAFMLSTDGCANSYASKEEYGKSCRAYYAIIKERGASDVAARLKDWLDETSAEGCGDDITAMFAYFS
jgi:serine/threonine protein phosphatase PrpC